MISNISTNRQNTSFGAALSTKQTKVFDDVAQRAQEAINKKLGIKKDERIFIMPDFSMPEISTENTGMGRLFSPVTEGFVKLIKTYYKPDGLQVLPQNTNKRVHRQKLTPEMINHPKTTGHYFSPYSSSGTTFADYTINLFALSEKKYGQILTKQEADDFAAKNTRKDIVNAEAEMGFRFEQNPRIEILRKAYERFKKNDNPELNELHRKFSAYKNDPDEAKRLDTAAYFVAEEKNPSIYKKKSHLKKDDIDHINSIVNEIKTNQPDEIEFFKFRQFIADEHHKEAKKIHNDQGILLIGDCPFGFAEAEKFAKPDAFKPKTRWNLPWLNYKKMFNDDNTLGPAGEILEEKLKFFYKRFDAVRFDVGCDFVESQAPITPKEPDKVVKFIEKTAKDYYGESYNDKIFFEIFVDDLRRDKNLENVFKSRTLMTTQNTTKDLGNTNLQPQKCYISMSNHDIVSARTQYEYAWPNGFKHIPGADTYELENNQDVVRLKFGEFFTAPKKFIFYKDFFGQDGVFNFMDKPNVLSFRERLSLDFEKEYHTALQKGDGFNLMESLAIGMKSLELDKEHPELFKQVKEQGEILRKPGALTQKEADEAESHIEKQKEAAQKKQKLTERIILSSSLALLAGVGALYFNHKKQTAKQEPQTQQPPTNSEFDIQRAQKAKNPFAAKGFL